MKITLPTREQVEDIVYKKFGIDSKPTDFHLSTDGCITTFRDWASYWAKTPISIEDGLIFVTQGINEDAIPANQTCGSGVRPVLSLSEITKSNQDLNSKIINGVEEIEYGEYPQSILEHDECEKLRDLKRKNKLTKTKKSYTAMVFEQKEIYQEYEYKGNKYININNGRCINAWFKVEPITWLVDRQEDIMISKNVLACAVYSYERNADYEKSDIKKFLEKCFIKEIQPSKINENINEDISEEKINDLVDLISMLYPEEKQKEKSKVKIYSKKDIRD